MEIVVNEDKNLNGVDDKKTKALKSLQGTKRPKRKQHIICRPGIPKRHFLSRMKEIVNHDQCKKNSFTTEAREKIQLHLENDTINVLMSAMVSLGIDRKKITAEIIKESLFIRAIFTKTPFPSLK